MDAVQSRIVAIVVKIRFDTVERSLITKNGSGGRHKNLIFRRNFIFFRENGRSRRLDSVNPRRLSIESIPRLNVDLFFLVDLKVYWIRSRSSGRHRLPI